MNLMAVMEEDAPDGTSLQFVVLYRTMEEALVAVFDHIESMDIFEARLDEDSPEVEVERNLDETVCGAQWTVTVDDGGYVFVYTLTAVEVPA